MMQVEPIMAETQSMEEVKLHMVVAKLHTVVVNQLTKPTTTTMEIAHNTTKIKTID